MSRSHQSFNKRQKEKKKAKRRKEKQLRKEQRKEDNNKGANFDDMVAYVDQFGNITDVPPEDQKQDEIEIEAEDIVIGVPPKDDSLEPDVYTGKVVFFEESKGYGFIQGDASEEKYFFHINNVNFDIQAEDKVTFDPARGKKGMDAINVEKL